MVITREAIVNVLDNTIRRLTDTEWDKFLILLSERHTPVEYRIGREGLLRALRDFKEVYESNQMKPLEYLEAVMFVSYVDYYSTKHNVAYQSVFYDEIDKLQLTAGQIKTRASAYSKRPVVAQMRKLIQGDLSLIFAPGVIETMIEMQRLSLEADSQNLQVKAADVFLKFADKKIDTTPKVDVKVQNNNVTVVDETLIDRSKNQMEEFVKQQQQLLKGGASIEDLGKLKFEGEVIDG